MQWSLLASQLTFFGRNHFLELEEILSDKEEENLLKELLALIQDNNEKISPSHFFFKQGRDLWRKSPLLKKWLLRKKLFCLASALMRTNPIRLAFDQLFEIPQNQTFELHLQEQSSIQGNQCALLVRLNSLGEEKGFYCQKKKSLLFFQPTLPLSLDNPGIYWMVVFAENGARYIYNEKDPFTHFLKNEGYGFGDLLNRHPLLFC